MRMKVLGLLAGFMIPVALLLTGCGGGAGTSGPAAASVTGVASEGALITGKTVKLKDSTGKAAPDATTDAVTGAYTIDVKGLKAPFILTVTGTSGTYVSYAATAGTANVNPITTTVVALAAGTTDPASLFTNLKAVDVTAIAANYTAQATAVTNALQAALPTGVSAADYFTGTIEAGKGMDSVFDAYKITVASDTGITVKTKDASATTILSVPTLTSTTQLPVIEPTKLSLITLSPDKTSAIAGQNITITADVKIAGSAAADGTTVTFSTVGGQLSASSATTTGGKASVTITAGAAGSATVSAAVTGAVMKDKLALTFTAAPTYVVTLTPDTTSQVAGTPITITADVKLDGSAAADGTTLAFSTVGGQLSAASATTSGGKATVTITAGAAGSATVTAVAGSGTVNAGTSSPLALTFTAAPTPVITLTASASSAYTGQSITLTADVKLSGAAVADGTAVTFATTGGTLSASSATTSGGKASVTITAGGAGSASVTASTGGSSSSPVALTFAAAPTKAILKLKTTGTIPSGKKIGAWGVTIQFPATGLSIKTKTGSLALDKTVFFQSGVADPASFTFTYSGTSNAPDSTSATPYLLLASLGDVTDAANGMTSVGEIATLIFDIASGAAVPSKSSFILSNKSVASTDAGGVKLTTVDLDFDLTLQ